MSRDEQIFFDPGSTDLGRAARDVADSTGGKYVEQSGVDRAIKVFGAAVYLDEIEANAFVTGAVVRNEVGAASDPNNPAEWAIHDRLPLIWNLMQGPRYDEELARRGARLAFDRLVASGIGWPMVLTHDTDELIATYDVENGVREFPPGTSTLAAQHR